MIPTSTDSQPLDVHRRKRLKIEHACEVCRRRKVKCDGGRPVCGNCSKRPAFRLSCNYASSSLEGSTGSPHVRDANAAFERLSSEPRIGRAPVQLQMHGAVHATVLSNSATNEHSPGKVTSMRSDSDKDCGSSASHELLGSSSSSAFTGQIKAAIDAISGVAALPQSPLATPMVDVPLFPSFQEATDLDGMADRMECELPPRKQADSFVHAYWSLVDPLFPVLNRPQFMHSYSALFAGTTIDTNERIFLSILNSMFALAVQSQESFDPTTRERLSSKYIGRAHSLLHLPIWERGSIELIQCLLLMSQYLQCTKKSYQTWMVAGSAVRVAQGLGLHLPEIWTTPPRDDTAALRCRVWRACIIMDRMICTSHGRPSMISDNLVSVVIRMQRHVQAQQSKGHQLPHDDFVAKTLEIYEIIHNAVQRYFSTSPSHSPNVDWSSILDLSPIEEKLALILQIDGCLKRWEQSLPALLRYENSTHLQNGTTTRQATALHLRYLHSRIILLRPMLARCCLATEPESSPAGFLSERLMEQCASECISVAQQMINVINQHRVHDTSILPTWWFRVFYTYTAAVVLAVSPLRQDLFPRSETQTAWENALALFQAHEHLSESVAVCKTGLHKMFSSIEETQHLPVSNNWLDGNFSDRQDHSASDYLSFLQDLPFHLDHGPFFDLSGG
ncbi:hypothetical protein IQ07DRAFT_582349 [Pyrenochaeta sp. DS3sAY3a]|nr:hypothetical protein IQ07DRAFT_582349 [Pyrenochaeta sp. DS3sAY3a]